MCKRLSIIFAAMLLCGQLLSASPAPPSAGSRVLSPDEVASISSALEQSNAALKASSEEIKALSNRITGLSIFCGVLVAIDVGAVGLAVYEVLKK